MPPAIARRPPAITVLVNNALPAIRRIQSKSGSGAPTAAVTLTFDAPTTTGNALIVALSDYYATADPDTTISDSKNNTWKVAVNYTNGARVKVYYAENITGGSNHQVTLRTVSGAAFFVATAMEYAGVVAVSSLDGTATNRATATTYSATLTTTQAPDLLLGVHHVYGTTATFTPATGWTTVDRRTDNIYHQHQVRSRSPPPPARSPRAEPSRPLSTCRASSSRSRAASPTPRTRPLRRR